MFSVVPCNTMSPKHTAATHWGSRCRVEDVVERLQCDVRTHVPIFTSDPRDEIGGLKQSFMGKKSIAKVCLVL